MALAMAESLQAAQSGVASSHQELFRIRCPWTPGQKVKIQSAWQRSESERGTTERYPRSQQGQAESLSGVHRDDGGGGGSHPGSRVIV